MTLETKNGEMITEQESKNIKTERKAVPSSKAYLDFILGQLSELNDITCKAMMGEFIIYYQGKIVGGIYDDRLLIKPVKSAQAYMPSAPCELPYDGAKEMLLVENVDDKEYLANLFRAIYDELPFPQSGKARQKNGAI